MSLVDVAVQVRNIDAGNTLAAAHVMECDSLKEYAFDVGSCAAWENKDVHFQLVLAQGQDLIRPYSGRVDMEEEAVEEAVEEDVTAAVS